MTHAQKPPQLKKWFWRDNGFYSIDHLTLSSDSIFFYSSYCECGRVFVSKGTWKIKGNSLYLNGWDSTKAYPKPKLEFIKGESEYVTIIVKDYFQKPFDGISLELIPRGDSTNANAVMIFADSLGKFTISKTEYAAFYFVYQMHNCKLP